MMTELIASAITIIIICIVSEIRILRAQMETERLRAVGRDILYDYKVLYNVTEDFFEPEEISGLCERMKTRMEESENGKGN